jgi:predicted lipoprotein with Yx(FWY)xxD motif
MGVSKSEGSQMTDGKRAVARISAMTVAAITGFAVAALTGLAFATTTPLTLKKAHNAVLNETIVVNSTGRTLYALHPETTHHLLCKSTACFSFWPPYKVSKTAKLTKATGIKGKLGRIHRKGFYQVTLNGLPLYRFSGDSAKAQANGNGIKAFGGTWHVIKVAPSTQTGSTTTTTSSSTTYTYPF